MMKYKWKIILLLIGLVLLTILWLKRDSFFANRTTAISSVSTTNVKNIDLINVPVFYNQGDKKWAEDKLGNTSETVGKVGCLVSSVGMNLSYYGINMNPKEINEKLTKIEGYTSRGWLIWSKLSTITNEQVQIIFPTLSHENIKKYLLAKEPVLAKVFIARIIPHWVLIVGEKDGEYLMLDPLTEGEPMKLSSYGSYVYSIRVLKKFKESME